MTPMPRSTRRRLPAGALATCLVLAASAAVAAPRPGPSNNAVDPAGTFTPPAPVQSGLMHVSLGTIINEGVGPITVQRDVHTDTDLPTKIKCPAAGGCTINFKLWAQVHPLTGGNWDLCPLVDGYPVFAACYYLSFLQSDDTGTLMATYQVAQGVHHVRTRIDMQGGGTLNAWHYEYEILTP